MESIAEIWKDVQGYEGLYQVSNLGRIKSLGRFVDKLKCHYWQEEKILKLRKRVDGYLNVILSKKGKTKTFSVHRLVAMTFISNPENKPEVDHINAIKTDNSVNNLRWASHKENMNNSLTIAFLSISKLGENNPLYGKKLSEETKRKISDRLSGKNSPKAHKVKNIDTNEIFNTVKEASIKYNVSHSAIVQAIKKNRKCSGCHWEYV